MADFVVYDRVKETTTTTGTGTVTLAGAATGYQSFSAVGNGNKCFYCIEAVDANGVPSGSWEVGKGTYTSSGTTLSRDTVLSSSTGSAINFSAGTKNVFLVVPATPSNAFGASGTGHYPGGVPDPGSSSGTTAFLREDGTWVDLSGGGALLYSDGTTPVGNTVTSTSETAFTSSYTIAASTLAVGDVIRVKAYGVYSGTVLPTFRAKMKFGSTIMLDTGALTGLVTGSNLGWWAEGNFIVKTIGASGTIEAQGYAEFSTAATTGLSVNPVNTATITIDTTASQAVTITAQWGAGGTGQTITLREISVERLTPQAAPGTVTTIGSSDASLTITSPTTAPDAIINANWINGFSIINGYLAASVAASALTISIKNTAGNDPSSSNPVKVAFRSDTDTDGSITVLTLTAATSLVVSSGSTLGTSSAVAFRIWIVGFNDSSTFRIGVINCKSGDPSIYPLRDDARASSTAEGGAGAADLNKVFYTGTAVASQPYRILGYMEWGSGLAAAGTWSAGPTKIKLFGPGVSKPGDTVQVVFLSDGARATGTTALPVDNTTPQITEGTQFMILPITPVSLSNLLEIFARLHLTIDSANALGAALFDSTGGTNAIVSSWAQPAASSNVCAVIIEWMVTPPSISLVNYSIRAGKTAGANTYFNGTASAFFNGTLFSTFKIREIMG